MATQRDPGQAAEPPDREGLCAAIRAAHGRRAALHADAHQTAYRLFHGHGEGAPGLEIDRLATALRIRCSERFEPWLDEILDTLQACGVPTERIVTRGRGRNAAARWLRGGGTDARELVRDNGQRYELELLAPANPGLYLDARPARAWISAHAEGRRVLNLFAFTGSLGIAAAAGGAQSVLHVEMQKRALRRLKHNLLLNDLRADDRDLLREDLYRCLPRLAREGRTFDGIVLDPPPQVPGRPGRNRAGRAPIGQDYPALSQATAPLLAPGGWLLCLFSRRGRTRAVSEAEVLENAAVPLAVMARGTSGEDFPEADPEARLRFTVFRRPA